MPLQFADRLVEPELHFKDFIAAQGSAPAPVLFVIVTSVDFAGDRVGYNPANPPKDAEIRERVDRWWQLSRLALGWAAEPASSPGLLVGVFGAPGRQTVIASLRVDRGAWLSAETESGGLLRVPLLDPCDLDAFHLRGRRIAPDAGLRFGGVRAQFFVRLGVNGEVIKQGPR